MVDAYVQKARWKLDAPQIVLMVAAMIIGSSGLKTLVMLVGGQQPTLRLHQRTAVHISTDISRELRYISMEESPSIRRARVSSGVGPHTRKLQGHGIMMVGHVNALAVMGPDGALLGMG
jgi:hypothetical protein